jgi:polyphosphate:AMP phosphotransferase
MFEHVEVGQKVSKKAFAAQEDELRTRLLLAQQRARAAGVPVVVLVSGVEGSGKGDVVNRLSSWVDARNLRIEVFWEETDEERQRPPWWRYWRALSPRGTIGVLFGSWYTHPIVERAHDRSDDAAFHRELERIARIERMLAADGVVLVKLWFHLSAKDQLERFDEDERRTPGRWTSLFDPAALASRYKRFVETSADAIRATDQPHAPWHLIEATDPRHRDLTAGQVLLAALEAAAPEVPAPAPVPSPTPPWPRPATSQLDAIDLSAKVEAEDYKDRLEAAQDRLAGLAWRAWRARRSTVLVFEGVDAAGKGGAIRRLADPVDPRLLRIIPIAAPTDEERAQPYLWRFWRHVPRDGRMTLFDRSWYGRVLVERVEGFAATPDWQRAYAEINEFEAQLVEHGATVLKFWLQIDADTQARRFKQREETPWKQHKITAEDWRNRARWDDYRLAAHDMLQRTHTPSAPWQLVAANDKRHARLAVIERVCEALSRTLGEKLPK